MFHAFPLYGVFIAIICIIRTRRGYSSCDLAVIFQLNSLCKDSLPKKYRRLCTSLEYTRQRFPIALQSYSHHNWERERVLRDAQSPV